MQYTLVRSDRKTIALSVDQQGILTVRAPRMLPVARVEAFVLEKRDWVEKTRTRLAALPPPPKPLTLTDGVTIPFLGQSLTLRLSPGSSVCLSGATLLAPQADNGLRAVARWLDAQARVELTARAHQVSQRLSLSPQKIRFTHGYDLASCLRLR